MRATPRAAAATIVAVALALFLAACDPVPTPAVGRERGAAWLINQFGSDGVIAASFDPSLDDLGGTAFAVANLEALDIGHASARQAAVALSKRVDEFVVDGTGEDRPGSLARLVIAAEATRMNPRRFGGTNLVARLEATIRLTGPDAGLFGVQDPTYDGAFRQGLALAALSLVRPRPESITPNSGTVRDLPAVAWLLDRQCTEGSWMPDRDDLTAPCAFDPVTFTGPDTNSTALAVLGARAVGASTTADAGRWLRSVRSRDGGWSSNGGTGTSADPDSTGVVMAALLALGTPSDQRATDRLLSFQFGPSAAAGDRGAFWYPPFDESPRTPSLLATNDALLGLLPGVWPAVVEP